VGANDKVGSAQLLGSVALDPAVSFGGFHTYRVTYTVAPSVIFGRFGSPIQISRPIDLPIDPGDLGHRLRSFQGRGPSRVARRPNVDSSGEQTWPAAVATNQVFLCPDNARGKALVRC
jgi:hypothetical protein